MVQRPLLPAARDERRERQRPGEAQDSATFERRISRFWKGLAHEVKYRLDRLNFTPILARRAYPIPRAATKPLYGVNASRTPSGVRP